MTQQPSDAKDVPELPASRRLPHYPAPADSAEKTAAAAPRPAAARPVPVTDPPGHRTLGIIGTVLFFPVGIFALLRSAESSRACAAGDRERARAASTRARTLSTIAIAIGVPFWVLGLGLGFILIGLSGLAGGVVEGDRVAFPEPAVPAVPVADAENGDYRVGIWGMGDESARITISVNGAEESRYFFRDTTVVYYGLEPGDTVEIRVDPEAEGHGSSPGCGFTTVDDDYIQSNFGVPERCSFTRPPIN